MENVVFLLSLTLPECYCEVHKISGLITNCDNSWLWVDYSAVVIFYLVHAVDDVPLGAVIAVRADNINLKNEWIHEYRFKSLKGCFKECFLFTWINLL